MFLSLSDGFFWLYALYFPVCLFLAFFIPGSVILRRLKLETFQHLYLSVILGMAMWIWQGFIFGFLNIRVLSYLYIIAFCAIWIYQNKNLRWGRITKARLRIDKLITLLIIVGVLVQVSAVILTGIKIKDGAYFCCGNISDSMYHIALTSQIVKKVPPNEPGMSGVTVQNYHYLANLLNADLIRVFRLPLVSTQYQFMTLLISLLLGLGAISFAKANKLSKNYLMWLLFFLYFGGDLIYLFLVVLGKGLTFQMNSLEDGSIFLVNPPRAYAIVMFFGGLSMLSLWNYKKSRMMAVSIGIIIAVLIGLKVYVGLFMTTGLTFYTLYFLYKKEWKVLIIYTISCLGSLLFYLPVNGHAGGIYYTGFWVFENYISQPRFNLIRLELARTIYQQHNNQIKVFMYEALYVFIYIVTIFGTKVLAFFQTKKSLSCIPIPINLLLVAGLIMSAILGFFFQQDSGGSNSFNFLVSIFIISSIYAALAVSYWLSKFPKPLSFSIGLIIILLTIPRAINQVNANIIDIARLKGFIIPNEQLKTFSYIKTKTPENSLILGNDAYTNMDETSPFVSFLIDRPMFLSGKGILDSHNVPTEKRFKDKKYIMTGKNPLKIAKVIHNDNISYLLLLGNDMPQATQTAEFLHPIYNTKTTHVLAVSRRNLQNFLDRMKKDNMYEGVE